MLYDVITDYCHRCCEGEIADEVCVDCNHPSSECSGSCNTCLDEVHYGGCGKRKDYECGRLLLHYTLRFSSRYKQNIGFALSKIDLTQFDRFNILSIGCGPAPDLMAFEEIAERKIINYKGIDKNELWKEVHDRIDHYSETTENMRAKLYREDAFDILQEDFMGGNVVVIQFLISHLYNTGQIGEIGRLYDLLIQNVLEHRRSGTPFLFIFNDIDTMNKGRDKFYPFLDKLEAAGYTGVAYAFSAHPTGDLGRNRFSHRKDSDEYGNISYHYLSCPCNKSAMLIIEVD